MAKYKHTEETKVVLDDLENRVQQLIEASELIVNKHPEIAKPQIQAFQAVLTLLSQVRTTGHVFRGSSAVPDGLEPYTKTKFAGRQLKIGETA